MELFVILCYFTNFSDFDLVHKIQLGLSYWIHIPYMQKFSQYEIFAEQEANRIFAIIFSRITGPSWKGSTCYVLLQISNCCKLANFHGLNFCWSISDREIREIYIPRKFPSVQYSKLKISVTGHCLILARRTNLWYILNRCCGQYVMNGKGT